MSSEHIYLGESIVLLKNFIWETSLNPFHKAVETEYMAENYPIDPGLRHKLSLVSSYLAR